MVNLGDQVRDMVSGFKGIAVSRHSYLQGCDRITVQPSIDKDGKLPESASFDEPQLEVLKAGKVRRTAAPEYSGGPEKFPDSAKHLG